MMLVCISGPDKGRRLVLTDSVTTLGRSSDCHLLSDDGDVTEHHLTLSWTAGAVTYRTISGSTEAVAAHMIWDMSFELPLYLKYIALGFVAWVALLSMIQGGLRQIKNEQLKLAATHSG
ncbi:MAG TPA: FHA domain-containing protein [Methylomirabilota bacterium]|jgi:hypothetical protein